MVVRLVRAIPLIIALAVVAGVVYLIASWRYSPARAKELLIKVFTVLNGVLCVFFGIATLYALGEGNRDVMDLTVTFLAAAAIALALTRICRAVFLKNNPAYRVKPMRARKLHRWPWERR